MREVPGRELVLERERSAYYNAMHAAEEIGRFGVGDARYFDRDTLKQMLRVKAIRMNMTADGMHPVVFLTRDGASAMRKLCREDIVICNAVKREFLSHDLAAHRVYWQERKAIEKDGGEVLEYRTEAEFKRDLGRVTGRSRNVRADIEDFAREQDLSVIDGGIRIPDVRIVYEIDGLTRHVDLEIASAHHGSKSVQNKRAAGMRIYDRSNSTRSQDRHDDMARLLR